MAFSGSCVGGSPQESPPRKANSTLSNLFEEGVFALWGEGSAKSQHNGPRPTCAEERQEPIPTTQNTARMGVH